MREEVRREEGREGGSKEGREGVRKEESRVGGRRERNN